MLSLARSHARTLAPTARCSLLTSHCLLLTLASWVIHLAVCELCNDVVIFDVSYKMLQNPNLRSYVAIPALPCPRQQPPPSRYYNIDARSSSLRLSASSSRPPARSKPLSSRGPSSRVGSWRLPVPTPAPAVGAPPVRRVSSAPLRTYQTSFFVRRPWRTPRSLKRT